MNDSAFTWLSEARENPRWNYSHSYPLETRRNLLTQFGVPLGTILNQLAGLRALMLTFDSEFEGHKAAQ